MQPSHIDILSETASCKAFDKNNPFQMSSLSVESHEIQSLDVADYAQANQSAFLRLIDGLSAERRDMAIEYFVLRLTEERIAVMHGRRSQSMVGQELHNIVKFIGARIALGEHPSVETIKAVLVKENIPSSLHVSVIIRDLICREPCEFRSDIERLLSRVSQQLTTVGATLEGEALGILIAEALKRSGELQRSQVHLRRARKVFCDPVFLGQFEIDIEEERIDVLFTPRAGEVSNASQIERKRT